MMSPEQIYEERKNRIVTDTAVLSVPCLPVVDGDNDDWGIDEIIEDLKDSAKSFAIFHPSGCAGLAANQIGHNKRVIVVKTKKGFRAFVNPSFAPAGPLCSDVEGCLSRPGVSVGVKRHTKVYAKSNGGKRVLLVGFEARAFQHELDHLDGKMI